MPAGLATSAAVAGKPSPDEPGLPVPATVEMIPAVTLRTRLPPNSPKYRVPESSQATPRGRLILARLAVPPSSRGL
jgi:hypothetical protein